MRISHEKKFIFLSKPRCASESIRKMLDGFSSIKSSNNPPYLHHISALELKKQFTENGWKWEQYFKFISIRNPWDMLVSIYFYGKPNTKGLYFWNDPKRSNKNDPTLLMSFNDWISLNTFWYWSLDRFVKDSEGNVIVDKIIKFEDLENDMRQISDMLGLGLKRVIKINSTKHKDYHNYYNKKSIKRVSELFKFDIEVGNYKY